MKRPRTTIPLLILALAAALTACGKVDTPTQVTARFLEALRSGDSGTATQLLAPDMRQWRGFVLEAARDELPIGGKITVTLLEEVGNTAKVRGAIDMTPEQALEHAPNVATYYRNNRAGYQPLLSQATYQLLFEEEFWTGFFDITYITDRMSIQEGEPLHPYLDSGLDTAALERYLNNPPQADKAAIQAIEAIAVSIDTEESVNLDELREQLRPHLAALSEYALYARYLKADAAAQIDTNRKTYTYTMPLTLHRVDGEWLVALE